MKGIKLGFVLGLDLTIMIGMLNFGFGIASWNSLQTPFAVRYGWTDTQTTTWSVVLTTGVTSGMIVGSLLAGVFMKRNTKRNLILAMNILLLLGTGLSLVDNLYIMTVGKVLYGIGIGGLIVYCPGYMNEMAPVEVKGPFGTITNVAACVGILVPALFALWIPEKKDLLADSFYVTNYWRVVWAFPVVTVLLQTLLLTTVFAYDTPSELKSMMKKEDLAKLMSRMYEEEEIETRTQAIQVQSI
jgi:MFS family permease